MLSKEIIKQVRHIQIYTSRMVNDVFAGEYHSIFKGHGMEFDEVREYGPGDDVRSIDWNVTARTGKPHIKKFIEERELTVMIMVDASSSGEFGTYDKTKNSYAAEVSALLAFSAIKNKDKVGLIIFTDRVEKFIPPKKGNKHVLRVIQEILCFKPVHKGTDITSAIQFLDSISNRKAVTFLISDFMADHYKRSLKIANKRHDMIAIILRDPRELEMPDVGIIELQDAETGEVLLVDTKDLNIRKGYKILTSEELEETKKTLRSINIDYILMDTSKPYTKPLIQFFKNRERRKRVWV